MPFSGALASGSNSMRGIIAYSLGSVTVVPDVGGPQGLKRESEELLPPQLCAASLIPAYHCRKARRWKPAKTRAARRPAGVETARVRRAGCTGATGVNPQA